MRGYIQDIIEEDYLQQGSKTPIDKELRSDSMEEIVNAGEVVTVVDKVYNHINEKGTVSFDELSLQMGISKDRLLEIVDILERSRLIRLKHSILPNENAFISILNREHNGRKNSNGQELVQLKKTIREDITKLEDAVSSIEHNLNLWYSESEDKVLGDASEETFLDATSESLKLEDDIEKTKHMLITRLNLLNRTLYQRRTSLIKSTKDREKPNGGFLSNLFRRFIKKEEKTVETVTASSDVVNYGKTKKNTKKERKTSKKKKKK